MVICQECGKEFKFFINKKHLIKYHNLTIEEYIEKYPSANLDFKCSRKKQKKQLIGIENIDFIVCQICFKEFTQLNTHIRTHNLTAAQYKEKYPAAIVQIKTKFTEEKRIKTLKENLASGKTKHWTETKSEEEVREIYRKAGEKISENQTIQFLSGERTIWNKRETKETDERIAKLTEKGSATRLANPEKYSGENCHWYGLTGELSKVFSENNGMYGRSVFSVWVEKLGYEKANKKYKE